LTPCAGWPRFTHGMKQGARFLAGGLLAVFLLFLVFRGVDLGVLGRTLAGASWSLLAAAALVNLAHNGFRVWRWGALLEPVAPNLPFRPRFVAVIVGYLTTWTIPGRLGELVRPALLSVRSEVPIGPALGSVLADRLLDAGALVALCAVGLWLAPPDAQTASGVEAVRASLWFLLVAAGGFLSVLIVLSVFRQRAACWIEGRRGVLRRAGRACLSLARGVEALVRPRGAARIVVHSLLAWLAIGLATWCGVRSVGGAVSYGAVLVLLPLLALGVAVPTPSGAGSYHAAMAYGLVFLYGVPKETAVAAGLLMHLANVVPVVLLGLWFLHSERISFRDLSEAGRRVRRLGSIAEGEDPPTVRACVCPPSERTAGGVP